MKKMRKVLNLLGFLCLLLLASIGVSISPASPELPKSRKKNNETQVEIELVEKREESEAAADWRGELQ